MLLVPTGVEAQTVRATGKVSEIVALSIPPNSIHGDVDVDVVNSGSTVRITLSGHGSPVIRVPLMVRSNTGFRISATVESTTAELTRLSIVNVRGTGRLVSTEAVNNLEIPEKFDLRELQSPFLVLSGPRVSLGGTLESANNALQITLLLHVKHKSDRRWMVQLTLFHN